MQIVGVLKIKRKEQKKMALPLSSVTEERGKIKKR